MTSTEILIKSAAVLSILAALSIGFGIIGLVFKFGYPKIIRKDALTILKKLYENKKSVPFLYYLFGFGGFLLVFASICISRVQEVKGEYLFSEFGKVSGIIYGVLLFVGITRYSKLFVEIAKWHYDNKISDENAIVLFESFNKYAGETIAEHIAFIFLAVMILCDSISMILLGNVVSIIGYSGIIISIGLLLGNLEFFGLKKAFVLNRIFSSVSVIWLLALGIITL